ncbi:putative bifunctional inhibitor/plant lipid transfer protein/seed storage helical [Medicago truncatula]|uniref:Putative bifunctional inhibitor/plant lipid transfer protein/seed storage helical n=1 Tax=Medicago truncatula TaxID=3880 RepID=A0A396IUN5_MEDTR|nr:non-specific lipid transfer protein GPI-anchored 6 [Medicago truncatula]RHN69130.1 putative bifunctional inhibitor/plant lipid transfer protein/seed storage helical [Medicago truncatula]
MMVSNNSVTALLFLLLAGFVSSDLTEDRKDCADKLVTLASCLPYVGGSANTPTIDCCTNLKQVLNNTKKCICILIKDSNDPKLGFPMNATLAVQLPNACHIPSNISECVDLLHLSPKSPEAKVFEGLGNSTKTNSSTPISSGSAEKGSSSSSEEKSGGGLGRRWLVAEVVCAILPFLFISHFFILT